MIYPKVKRRTRGSVKLGQRSPVRKRNRAHRPGPPGKPGRNSITPQLYQGKTSRYGNSDDMPPDDADSGPVRTDREAKKNSEVMFGSNGSCACCFVRNLQCTLASLDKSVQNRPPYETLRYGSVSKPCLKRDANHIVLVWVTFSICGERAPPCGGGIRSADEGFRVRWGIHDVHLRRWLDGVRDVYLPVVVVLYVLLSRSMYFSSSCGGWEGGGGNDC